jgi:hypothetical protein
MRPRIIGSEAQVAMVDAILFMTIMLVASAVILGSSGYRDNSSADFAAIQQYTTDFTETYMGVDLNLENGSWRSVSQLLCDECLALRQGGVASESGELNSRILATGRNIIRPGLDFAISCDMGAVFISGNLHDLDSLPGNRCADMMTVFPGEGLGGDIVISVFVWVV